MRWQPAPIPHTLKGPKRFLRCPSDAIHPSTSDPVGSSKTTSLFIWKFEMKNLKNIEHLDYLKKMCLMIFIKTKISWLTRCLPFLGGRIKDSPCFICLKTTSCGSFLRNPEIITVVCAITSRAKPVETDKFSAKLWQKRPRRQWHKKKQPPTHTIHGTGVFTYMNGWFFMVNVGKYTIHGLLVVEPTHLSKWVHLPQGSRWKSKNIWNHHLANNKNRKCYPLVN